MIDLSTIEEMSFHESDADSLLWEALEILNKDPYNTENRVIGEKIEKYFGVNYD